MVRAAVNSHQCSSKEVSEKLEIMITNVSDLKELSWEKYKRPLRLSFCEEEIKDSSRSASLCMRKYIHTTFKITLAYTVCVASQQCC